MCSCKSVKFMTELAYSVYCTKHMHDVNYTNIKGASRHVSVLYKCAIFRERKMQRSIPTADDKLLSAVPHFRLLPRSS